VRRSRHAWIQWLVRRNRSPGQVIEASLHFYDRPVKVLHPMLKVAVIERAALDHGHRGEGARHKWCVVFAVYRRAASAATDFGAPRRRNPVPDRREGGEAVEPALRSARDFDRDLGAVEVLQER